MRMEEADPLARGLMAEHGLADWLLVWATWRDRAAQCLRPIQWIIISWPFVAANGEEGVREIVLHEIAHALTEGEGERAHDAAWVEKCREIGGSGKERPEVRWPEGGGQVVCREEAIDGATSG